MITVVVVTSLLGCGEAEEPDQAARDTTTAPQVVTKQEPPLAPGMPLFPTSEQRALIQAAEAAEAAREAERLAAERMKACMERARLDPEDFVSRCLSGNRYVDVPIGGIDLRPGMTNNEVRCEIWKHMTPELRNRYGQDCLVDMTRHELVPNSKPDHVRCYLVDRDMHLRNELGPIIHRPGYRGGVSQVRRMACWVGGVLTFVDFGAGYCEAAEDDRGNGGALVNGLCNVLMPLPVPVSLNDVWRQGDYGNTMFDRMNYQLEQERRQCDLREGPPPEICKYLRGENGLSPEMQQRIVRCYHDVEYAAAIQLIRNAYPNITDAELRALFDHLKCPKPNHHYRIDLPMPWDPMPPSDPYGGF